jgi:hypothetical protein
MHAIIMGWKQKKVLDNSDCSGYEFDYGYSVQHSFSYAGVTTVSGSVIVRFFFPPSFVMQIYWEWFPV